MTWREDGAVFTLSWPAPLPVPRIDGASAVYESIAPDVNLHVLATATGFRHVVEVRSARAARSAAVRALRYVPGGNLRVVAATGGGLRLVDTAGRAVAGTHAASMWDSPRSSAEPAGASGPSEASRVAAVAVGVTRDALTVRADTRLLDDPGLTYPVFIDPHFAKNSSRWAYANSINSNWDLEGKAWVGRNPYDGTRYRSFYQFDVSALKGKHVLAATVRTTLWHSWSCGDTSVHLYRTGGLTVSNGARMSWGTQPLPSGTWLDSAAGHANKAGGCGTIQPDMVMEFQRSNLTNDVQYAATKNWSAYTVGLCACDPNGQYESSQDRWKKFYTTKTYLEVTYNSTPSTPTNRSTSNKACGSAVGTTSPTFRSAYVDADPSDFLRGTYVYKQLPSGIENQVTDPVARSAGGTGEVMVPLGAAAEGKTYAWKVQTRDSAGDVSPWSAWCDFTVVTNAGAVSVTSPTYINCDSAPGDASCADPHGGPGISASFTIRPQPGDAGASNIVKYQYGWTDTPDTERTVSPGGEFTTALTPPRHGLNTLYVRGLNAAGTPGPLEAYQFLVGAPAAPLAHWPLDTVDGHRFSDQVGDADLTIDAANDDFAWVADTRLISESTVRLDTTPGGTRGALSATGTGLDTSGSFSVSAWVRLGTLNCPDNMNVVSIDGTSTSAFMLGYNCWVGTWRMRIADADSNQATYSQASSSTAAVAGRWTHLVGVWDEAERKLRLYVNGSLAAAVTPTDTWLSTRGAGWKALGPVTLGRELWSGLRGGYMSGEIADVRVWNRVVVPDDLTGTDEDPSAGTGATPGLLTALPVAFWDFAGNAFSGCAEAISASYWAQLLAPDGCTDPPSAEQTAGFTGDSHDGNDALWLNHVQPDGYGAVGAGYASHPGPVVRTDQSFTVAAWVRIADLDGFQGVASQDGQNMSAFRLDFDPWAGNAWCFRLLHSDTPGASDTRACGGAPRADGSWQHLVGVYDSGARELRLYADGQLVASTAFEGTAWHAGEEFTVGRLLHTSATPARTFGYFHGEIDEVAMYAGALAGRDVANLCSC